MSNLLTVKEAAEILGISGGRVRGLSAAYYKAHAKPGKLVEVKSGRRVYITRNSVEARIKHLENRRAQKAAKFLADGGAKQEKQRKLQERRDRLAAQREAYGRLVLAEIKRAKEGLTKFECANALGLDTSDVWRAICDLRTANAIVENGRRETGFGGAAIVWVLSNE